MLKFPIPQRMARDIYEITPQYLKSRDVELLLLDLDNTMSPYHIHEPSGRLIAWIESMKEQGIEPFILSNNRGDRPKVFADALGVGYINRAHKPSTEVLLQVLKDKGVSKAHTALIGDQIYTDMLCAVRSGVMGICVKPICLRRNPLLAIRYFAEFPFRIAYKEEEL